jgi:Mce-associated membrane protein
LTRTSTRATGSFLALALVVLSVLSVLSVLVAAVLVYRSSHLTDAPFSLSNSGRAVPPDAERHKVVAVAEQFCLRVDGFDGDQPDEYKKSVTEMLTTKYKKAFDTEFAAIQQLGVQKGQKGKGTIVASGVGTLDGDSATVLVVHDNTITSSSGTTERHSRWTVDLNKVDGKWLVDDFTPVS